MTEFIDYNELSKIDLYKILRVEKDSTFDKIKKRFRHYAKKYHPDKNPNFSDRYDEIQIAYFVLSNESRRNRYDLSREEIKDDFNVLKEIAKKQINKDKQSDKPSQEQIKNFNLTKSELEKKHGLFEFIEKDVNNALKDFENKRKDQSILPKLDTVLQKNFTGQNFNQSFVNHIKTNGLTDLVKYNGDAIISTNNGGFTSLEKFNELYVNSGPEGIFRNKFSTLQDAFDRKFVQSDNNFMTHNVRDNNYKQNLKENINNYHQTTFEIGRMMNRGNRVNI